MGTKGYLFWAVLFALPAVIRIGHGGSYNLDSIEIILLLSISCGLFWIAGRKYGEWKMTAAGSEKQDSDTAMTKTEQITES